MNQKVIIIGVCGGSGSGKTTLARMIRAKFGKSHCAILGQDNYYIDQSDRFDGDGGQVNFDHPSAIDFPLMAQHLQELKSGKTIEVPIYDFATHKRKPETISLPPSHLIIVDGILILSQPIICQHLDTSIFLNIDDQTRFERRLNRDVKERGREAAGVKKQIELQVLPMHRQFVAPSVHKAKIILNHNEESEEVVEKIFQEFMPTF